MGSIAKMNLIKVGRAQWRHERLVKCLLLCIAEF